VKSFRIVVETQIVFRYFDGGGELLLLIRKKESQSKRRGGAVGAQ
jgi:hypothetical protein